MLELFIHLSSIVDSLSGLYSSSRTEVEDKKSKKGRKSSVADLSLGRTFTDLSAQSLGHQLALSQSAVICLDTLTRGLKSATRKSALQSSWVSALKASLGNVLSVSSVILKSTLSDTQPTESTGLTARIDGLRSDELKILGSLLLLSSSISAALGPAALNYLSVSDTSMLHVHHANFFIRR
jgi:hypothetical protein